MGQTVPARFCARLKQVLPSSSINTARSTAAGSTLLLALSPPRIFLQSIFSSSVDHIPSCSIVSLVLVPIALQKWGSTSSSFLASSIATIPASDNMKDPFPDGAVFFLEWPTWARLALVLGGTFGVVLILAFLVRLRNWVRDKRRAKRAAAEQAERGEMALVADQEDDAFFGIRALLEDPEVEGVWNSGEATPTHLDGGVRPSASHLKINPPRHSSNSSTTICDAAEIGLGSPTALTPFIGTTTFINKPGEASTPKKGKTLVISYNGPYSRSEAAEIVSDVAPSTAVERSPSPSKMQLRPTTNLSSSGSRKFVIGNRPRNSPRHQRVEVQSEINPLERMEAHRRLHSAESGQLHPRDRRHSEMAETIPLSSFPADSEDSDDSISRALSWPAREGMTNLGKQLSRRVQRMEGPSPVPFRAFVESLPTTKPPPSAWTDRTQARIEAKVPCSKASDTTSKTSTHTANSSTSSTISATAPTSFPSDFVSIANTRSRKVNDGFEVLPAGTLEKEPKVKEFGTWHESSGSQKKPRKLQKRTRSDSASRSSTKSQRLSSDSCRLSIL
ncbi:hypothetical protein PV04_06573 [Phialophora macrospora]|uniref:Uncharacterized protein n=1 Tax=Phialophora macrospora TaxID=1851006 RepID=A0A0D2G5M4_9EURO|nr:hypothetical protein PV04_06573 [Phialophora macrospora]